MRLWILWGLVIIGGVISGLIKHSREVGDYIPMTRSRSQHIIDQEGRMWKINP